MNATPVRAPRDGMLRFFHGQAGVSIATEGGAG